MSLTRNGRDVDLLAEGARLAITLEPDGSKQGSTHGSLVLPAGSTELGEAEVQSLDGSYSYDPAAGTVAFDHDSDSFFPYLDWLLEGNLLRPSFSAGGDQLRVILERED